MAKNKWFGTDGVRGTANVFPITADFAMKLAMAAAERICTNTRRAAIARDTRISGEMLEAALTAGFAAKGVDVLHLGILPTPAVTTLTPVMNIDMAVMITASHNPYQDNGIKLIAADGYKFADEVTAELEALIEKGGFEYESDKIGRVQADVSALEKYREIALSMCGKESPLQGLKVVVDCANGCFSGIMPEIFARLGAEVTTIGCCPDGYNINRECGSQHVEAMLQKVRECGADLGIAVDGDGDRIKVCNEKGELVRSEQLIAFLAKYLQDCGELKGRPVVSTVLSNTGLEKFVLNDLQLAYYSTPVGERHVIEKMRLEGGAVGGEESGHIVLTDYSRSGDALMVALVLARGLKFYGKKMSEMFPLFDFEPLVFENPRFESREQVKAIAGSPELQDVLSRCRKRLEGIGRAVIHPSGTEPLVRVWVCGKDEKLVHEVSETLLSTIEKLRERFI